MPGPRRRRSLARVLLPRTAVPDGEVRIVKPRKNVLGFGDGGAIYRNAHLWGRVARWWRPGHKRQAALMPGVQATIQVDPVTLPQHIQRPRQPPGPAAALVVERHHLPVCPKPKPTSEPRQPLRIRQPAGGRRRAAHQLGRFHAMRTLDVRRVVHLPRGHLHHEQVFSLGQPRSQLLGGYDSRIGSHASALSSRSFSVA